MTHRPRATDSLRTPCVTLIFSATPTRTRVRHTNAQRTRISSSSLDSMRLILTRGEFSRNVVAAANNEEETFNAS